MTNDRDLAFDLLIELADFTFDRNLPKTSLRIEAALDAFLEETGRKRDPRAHRATGPRSAASEQRSSFTVR